MHFNVYVDDQLGHQLTETATAQGVTRNRLIRIVLKQYIDQHNQDWPQSILDFKGDPDFPAFETSRSEFLPEREDPFA